MCLRALTLPGLALSYQKGSTVVAWTEQQLLRLLPADALIQPPVRTVGTGRASPGCQGHPAPRGPSCPNWGMSCGHSSMPCHLPKPQHCSGQDVPEQRPESGLRVGQVLWWSHVPQGPPWDRSFSAFTCA